MQRVSKAVSEWKGILVTVLVSIFAIMLADFVLVLLFGSQIRSFAVAVFGSNDVETLVSLLFLEGGFCSLLGALLAIGFAELKIVSPFNPAAPCILTKISSQREEHRRKQISAGTFLILVGGPLLAIALIYALIALR